MSQAQRAGQTQVYANQNCEVCGSLHRSGHALSTYCTAGMNSPNRHHNPVIIILQRTKLQHRGVMQLALGCTASKRQEGDVNPEPPGSRARVLTHQATLPLICPEELRPPKYLFTYESTPCT